LDIPCPTGKTADRRGAQPLEPSERHYLAAYLVDLLPEATRRSEAAASYLRLAVAALDPAADLTQPVLADRAPVGASPVAPLVFALRDLTPGTGPHFWLTMAVEILTGQRSETVGTS
jgi:hypothetical protein